MANENVNTSVEFLNEGYKDCPEDWGKAMSVDAKAVRCLAYLVMKLEGTDEATILAKEAVECDPLDVENHVILLEVLEHSDSPPQLVIDACRDGLELLPHNLDLRLGLIAALLRQEKPGKAVREARIAVEKHPNNPRAHDWLAKALSRLAETLPEAEALPLKENLVDELRIVVKADPTYLDACSTLAFELELLGKTEEAAEFQLKSEKLREKRDEDCAADDGDEPYLSTMCLVSEAFKNESRDLSVYDLVEALLFWGP